MTTSASFVIVSVVVFEFSAVAVLVEFAPLPEFSACTELVEVPQLTQFAEFSPKTMSPVWLPFTSKL